MKVIQLHNIYLCNYNALVTDSHFSITASLISLMYQPILPFSNCVVPCHHGLYSISKELWCECSSCSAASFCILCVIYVDIWTIWTVLVL